MIPLHSQQFKFQVFLGEENDKKIPCDESDDENESEEDEECGDDNEATADVEGECTGVDVVKDPFKGAQWLYTFEDYPCISIAIQIHGVFIDLSHLIFNMDDEQSEVQGQCNSGKMPKKMMEKPATGKGACAVLTKCCAPQQVENPALFKGCMVDWKQACCEIKGANEKTCCLPPGQVFVITTQKFWYMNT